MATEIDAGPDGHHAHARATARAADPGTLITDNLPLVQHIVNEVSVRFPRHVERQELWNAGALGLVESAQRYDETTGIPFNRFAAIRIRGAILDSTRSRDWASRGVRRKARELSEADESVQWRLGRSATSEELAEELDVGVSEIEARRAATEAACLLHLDQQFGGQEDGEPTTSLGDLIEELTSDRLPEEALEQRELIGTLRTAVKLLPDRLGTVIERYYYRGEYLRDIAESLEVTEARASQLRSEAIASLQAYFSAHYEPTLELADLPGSRRRAAYVAEASTASTWRSRLGAADQPPHLFAGRA